MPATQHSRESTAEPQSLPVVPMCDLLAACAAAAAVSTPPPPAPEHAYSERERDRREAA